MHSSKIAVPKGNYEAKVFNTTSKEFELAPVSVLCHLDFVVAETDKEVESCFAHVSMLTKSRDVSLLMLSRKDTVQDV